MEYNKQINRTKNSGLFASLHFSPLFLARYLGVMSFEGFVAISEFEIFKVEKAAKQFCVNKNKPFPPEQLYIDYRMEDQTLYFLEVRPKWDDPTKKIEILVAKFMYVKKDKVWKLYWSRQNSKWQQYEPNGINQHLEPLFKIVSEDLKGCFWG